MTAAPVVLVGTSFAEPEARLFELVVAAVVGVVLVVAVLPLYLGNRIDLEEETIHIVAGMTERHVPYEAIISIRPLRSYTTHFLPSFDVVEIVYRAEGRDRVVHVAPLDRDRFKRELDERRR